VRLIRSILLLVSAAVFVMAAPSCGGPTFVIQQYAGPSRSSDTIAIIRINGKDDLLWVSLDGEAAGARLPEDARFHIEVLPGRHTLGIRGGADSPTELVSFQAEPGRVYRPVLERGARSSEPALGGGAARMFEVDADRDTLLRDVTLHEPKADATWRPTRLRAPPPGTPAMAADAGSESMSSPELAGDAGNTDH